jgi:hypothetical protein
MIEVYGFLAVFLLQVLTLSVVYPGQFNKYVRTQASVVPTERLARLFPGVDLDLAIERFLTRHRVVNIAIGLLGLALLAWLFSFMRSPTWNEEWVIGLSAAYFMIQYLPLLFVGWLGFRWTRAHKSSLLDSKRKATLERRGLFDFTSPVTVFLAVAVFAACVALILTLQKEPFPGYALIGVLIVTYAAQAWVVYRALYGKSSNPFESQADRVHRIGTTIRVCVYGSMLCAVFFAFVFAVDLLDMKKWVPLAQALCLLSSSIFSVMSVTPRRPREGEPLSTADAAP